MPTVLRKEYEDDKYGILDVRVEMHDGTQIDFEMQVVEFDFWKKRMVFYLSTMVTDQIQFIQMSWRFMCWNWGNYHRKIRMKKGS